MLRYVLARLVLVLPTLWAVATLIFLLVRVIPGDIVELRLVSGGAYVTREVIQQERVRLGLDKPLWAQYGDWIAGLARLEPGTSMWTGAPVSREIAIRPEPRLQPALTATRAAVTRAPPLAGWAAARRGPSARPLAQAFLVAGAGPPPLCLGPPTRR